LFSTETVPKRTLTSLTSTKACILALYAFHFQKTDNNSYKDKAKIKVLIFARSSIAKARNQSAICKNYSISILKPEKNFQAGD